MKNKGEKEYEELILNTLRRLKSKTDNFEWTNFRYILLAVYSRLEYHSFI
jgi:hypothetical protein